MNETLIQLILGMIQGITEWLPIDSSGIIALVSSNFFGITNINELIRIALFLHLGTFLAAFVYFRKDVFFLAKSLFNYKKSEENTKKILKFLILSTLISGVIGFIIFKALVSLNDALETAGKTFTLIVGVLLLTIGIIQIKVKSRGLKKAGELKNTDGILLGVLQGVSSLPGISRSGITVSALLLRKFDDATALKLSFLMSLPIVLAANIFLNFQDFSKILSTAMIFGLLVSFIFGILTIGILMKLSKKINFGWFAIIFAILMLASIFL